MQTGGKSSVQSYDEATKSAARAAMDDVSPKSASLNGGTTSTETTVSITVVGASGDLAKEKIFPALFALYYEGCLPEVCDSITWRLSCQQGFYLLGDACNTVNQLGRMR